MIASVPITTPEDIVEDTMVKRVEGIAYTYNEPTVFAEYALDTMRIASKHGLYNVWVSNGYMSKELAKELVGTMDAINIDLKGNADFYTKIVGNAKVEFVMENITYLHRKGVHVEVTNLIVPGHNDSVEQIKQLCEFIASISPDVPLHFTRFFPHYKMQHVAPTPHKSLHKAYDVAKSYGLHYVYIGNVAEEHSTFCPACNNLLIARTSFSAKVVGLNKDGTCVRCNYQTNIKLAIPRH
jgi:pyruvate formate lyase activating enzyme